MGWKKQEARIYKTPNNQIRYAGRTDLKCLMLPHIDATRKVKVIADFKTGKAPNPKYHPDGYTEWPLQTAAYRHADGECDFNAVVHLDKETGTMGWFPFADTYNKDLKRFFRLCEYWWLTYEDKYSEKLVFGAPSVTTVCKVLDKPALIQWAVNCTVERTQELLAGISDPILKADVFAMLEDAKSSYRKVSSRAMDIGTQVHKHIEEWIKSDGKMEPPSDAPDEVTASFVAFLDWWKQHKVEPMETEKVVYGTYNN